MGDFEVSKQAFLEAHQYFAQLNGQDPAIRQSEPVTLKFMRKHKTDTGEKEVVRDISFVQVQGHLFAVEPDASDCLGEGSFGRVRRCRNEANELFALKIIGEEQVDSTLYEEDDDLAEQQQIKLDALADLQHELEILRQLNLLVAYGRRTQDIDPNYLDYDHIEAKHYVVMPLREGCDLYKQIEQQEMDTVTKLEVALKACQDIQMLHDKRIIHGDIKPENLMINIRGDQLVIAAVDFGHSLAMPDNQDYVLATSRGSGKRRAPELQAIEGDEKTKISPKTDVYALGYLLKNDLNLNDPIIDRMMANNPEDRVSLYEVMNKLSHLLLDNPQVSIKQRETVANIRQQIPVPFQTEVGVANKQSGWGARRPLIGQRTGVSTGQNKQRGLFLAGRAPATVKQSATSPPDADQKTKPTDPISKKLK